MFQTTNQMAIEAAMAEQNAGEKHEFQAARLGL